MPIFAVNLSEKLYLAIRDQVEKGHYQSIDNFLGVAAENQLALERGATPDRLIAADHRKAAPESEPPRKALKRVSSPAVARDDGTRREKPAKSSKKRRRKKLVKSSANKKEPEPAPPAPEVEIEAESVLSKWSAPSASWLPPAVAGTGLATGEHLWGQVNRLFALKLVARWVAKTANNKPWPRYLAIADSMADEAALVGEVLEQWDTAAKRTRDDVLATGLPRRGNSASRDRFLSQYLARVTRGSEVQPGAICLYAIGVCNGDTIALTAEGIKFALLPNPILDAREQASVATLSSDETAFLCQQIREHAPGEYADMQAVVGAVSGGKITPSATRGLHPDRVPRRVE